MKLSRLRPESESLLHLDALRLIAAAGIVVSHFQAKLAPGNIVHAISDNTGPFYLFVDLFFVVSGFVIAFVYMERMRTPADYGSFLQKRLARLGPLHWATLAVMAVIGVGVLLGRLHPNNPDAFRMSCLPANALFLHATGLCSHLSFNTPSWSISAEFFMYLSAPLLFWIGARSRLALGALAIGSFAALTIAATPDAHWVTWTWHFGVLRAIPSFALGVLLFLLKEQLGAIPGSRLSVWIALASFLAGCILRLPDYLLLAIVYVIVILAVSADQSTARTRRSTPRLVWMLAAGGQLTYSSYMLHDVVMIVLVTFVGEHVLHVAGTAQNLLVIFAFLLVWPISYLSLMLFERPLRKAISVIGRHIRPRPATVSDEAW